MKYFVTNFERKGTCYHEFYRGKWDGETFWRDDSLLLHDEVLFKHPGFAGAIKEVIPAYTPFGETEISFDDWKKIGQIIEHCEEGEKELYQEADSWLNRVFQENGCFTILGI